MAASTSVSRGSFRYLASFGFTLLAWSAAVLLWRRGEHAFAASAFAAGFSLGPALAGYLGAPRRYKQLLRRVVAWGGGLSVLAAALLGRVDLELEGFVMLVLVGTVGAALGHTLVTVIAGPLVFGRLLCGWGCWRAMVLELLPIGASPGRRRGAWRLLPFVGLAASIAAAGLLVLALGVRPGGTPQAPHGASALPIAATCLAYYALSVPLAFRLRDQRAFCKYLCPSSAVLRLTSRAAILKMAVTPDACDGCGACSRACPMDIAVAQYAQAGSRVLSGDCILCQRCAQACPRGALRLTAGLDLAGRASFRPWARERAAVWATAALRALAGL